MDIVGLQYIINITVMRKQHANLTISCKYCSKDFRVRNNHSSKEEYCSKECNDIGLSSPNRIKKNIKCQICHKDFKSYSDNVACSQECYSLYVGEMKLAGSNPDRRPNKKPKKSKCKNCKKSFSYIGISNRTKRSFCSLRCFIENGKSKYSENSSIYTGKDKTKKQNKSCLFCHSKEKLKIYDNNKSIILCGECFTLTKKDELFWSQLFACLISNSKIVKKEWGFEIHVVNNSKYCLKYLVFFKDRQFSLHFHNFKKELWFCSYGMFECYMKEKDWCDYSIFKMGDKIEIEPGVEHQLHAIENSIIVEVSTPDYPEDSIRLISGIN